MLWQHAMIPKDPTTGRNNGATRNLTSEQHCIFQTKKEHAQNTRKPEALFSQLLSYQDTSSQTDRKTDGEQPGNEASHKTEIYKNMTSTQHIEQSIVFCGCRTSKNNVTEKHETDGETIPNLRDDHNNLDSQK